MISKLLERVGRMGLIGVVCLATLLWGTGLFAKEAAVAMVTGVSGEVEVLRIGTDSWRAARVGDTLFVGDELRTGDEAWVELNFDNEAFARVEAGSHVAVEGPIVLTDVEQQPDDVPSTLRMWVGRLWVHVVHRIERWVRFSVETPHAVAGVRGTVFYIEVLESDPGTIVGVREGSVAVAMEQSEVMVEAGRVVKVRSEKTASLEELDIRVHRARMPDGPNWTALDRFWHADWGRWSGRSEDPPGPPEK